MDKLDMLRKQIDQIDKDLLMLFVKRFSIVKKIGKYKKDNNLPIINEKIEDEKINMLSQSARNFGVSESFIQAIWRTIFAQSHKLET